MSFEMQYRPLGKTGKQVSVIGLGTWQFGGEWGQKFSVREVRNILAAARDVGLNFIDTAECYGDHVSEKLLGKAVKDDGGHWIIATKFGHKFKGFLERQADYSVAGMKSQLEKSLKALKREQIDLYQAHGVSEETFANDELWTVLDKLKQEGKIGAIGVSINYDALVLDRDIIDTVQVVYNRLDREAEKEIFPKAKETNLGVLARVPLASGFLSGKYSPGSRWSKKDVRKHMTDENIDSRLREVEKIKENELPEGVSLAAWALAWCLKNPLVSTVIPGCKSVEQALQNASAVELL